jgi:hypothetical protein
MFVIQLSCQVAPIRARVSYTQSGTSNYFIEDEQLIVEGGQFVTASIEGIPGEAQTTRDVAEYTCSPERMELFKEGFPPLTWTRVQE